MDRLSREFPAASIVVVGRTVPPVAQPWWDACARFLARPNVHAMGWRPRRPCRAITRRSTSALIPYRLDHPFNRACNPTKIMDAMGSGRPIVATAIPECRLHAERFHVAEDADEFIAAVREILDRRFGRRPRGAAACLCPGQYVPRHRRADSGPDRRADGRDERTDRIGPRLLNRARDRANRRAETDGNWRRRAVKSFPS